jgi:hypothetical protein
VAEEHSKRREIFSIVRSRQDALNVVTDTALAFFAVAAVLVWMSFGKGWQNLVDAAFYVVLAILMWRCKSPADTAFAWRPGAGGRAKTRCPQAADFIGNVSARQGGGEFCITTVSMPPSQPSPARGGRSL